MATSPLKGFPRPIQIKEEPLSDLENEAVCKLCSKGFTNDMALRNHVRIFHISAYLTGDPAVWTAEEEQEEEEVQIITEAKHSLAEFKSEDPPSSPKPLPDMKPSLLTTLASTEVSYIILKADPSDLEKADKAKRKKKDRNEKPKEPPKKLVQEKKAKLTQPITGPFECVETSRGGTEDGVCHQIFFSCCEYSQHVRAEHARRRRTPRCQVCERLLPPPGARAADPLRACPTCGEEFPTPDDVQEHMNTAHVKNKRYECCVCHKRFTQQAGVQQHMRMHTGDRPYTCTFCPKAFTQKSGLEQHLRTHTKVKPYRCVICTKSFCQSVHLKQHIRTHTNVAPFQCGICEKRFKQSSHLNYHLKNHNPATMTEDQREKYNELIGLMKRNTEVDEQAMAEQSIQEEIQEDGNFDINDSMVYIEVDQSEFIM